jgi:hypothetical protein
MENGKQAEHFLPSNSGTANWMKRLPKIHQSNLVGGRKCSASPKKEKKMKRKVVVNKVVSGWESIGVEKKMRPVYRHSALRAAEALFTKKAEVK